MLERKWWFKPMVFTLAVISAYGLFEQARFTVSGQGLLSAPYLILFCCWLSLERLYRHIILFALGLLKPEWVKSTAA